MSGSLGGNWVVCAADCLSAWVDGAGVVAGSCIVDVSLKSDVGSCLVLMMWFPIFASCRYAVVFGAECLPCSVWYGVDLLDSLEKCSPLLCSCSCLSTVLSFRRFPKNS